MIDADLSSRGKFGKNVRLKGRGDFLQVVRGRQTIRHTGEFCRLAAASSVIGSTRFGISVSRKAGNSVARNRIKRIIREYLRLNMGHWPSQKSVVISVDRPCADIDALIREIEFLLDKIK